MILRLDRVVQTAQGQAVAGALVYFLTQPANTETLTPLANVYSDTSGTTGANPQVTDGLGQIGCYLDNSQLYTMVVVSPFLDTQVYPDQNLGNSAASSSVFGLVPTGTINGTNVTFTLAITPRLLFVQQNNTVLVPEVGYTTAVVAGTFTITLANPPEVGDALYASGIF
jgi:hypothetical protein